MDNGIDAMGDNLQPAELNYIQQGKRYVADRLPPDAVLCIRRYHFEVFALDQILNLRAGANREDLVKLWRACPCEGRIDWLV